mmetsp:Transcript_24800/g.53934  ORF Transcript_24800/g.53934 Transcript_24800/m.53934 type:complete len:287 (+) Transcript_24800:175-1035(+)
MDFLRIFCSSGTCGGGQSRPCSNGPDAPVGPTPAGGPPPTHGHGAANGNTVNSSTGGNIFKHLHLRPSVVDDGELLFAPAVHVRAPPPRGSSAPRQCGANGRPSQRNLEMNAYVSPDFADLPPHARTSRQGYDNSSTSTTDHNHHQQPLYQNGRAGTTRGGSGSMPNPVAMASKASSHGGNSRRRPSQQQQLQQQPLQQPLQQQLQQQQQKQAEQEQQPHRVAFDLASTASNPNADSSDQGSRGEAQPATTKKSKRSVFSTDRCKPSLAARQSAQTSTSSAVDSTD